MVERLRRSPQVITFLTHLVKFTLVFEHSVQITSHLICHSAYSLVDFVCLISIFQVVDVITTINIKRGLGFIDGVACHGVHSLDLLGVVAELRT